MTVKLNVKELPTVTSVYVKRDVAQWKFVQKVWALKSFRLQVIVSIAKNFQHDILNLSPHIDPKRVTLIRHFVQKRI